MKLNSKLPVWIVATCSALWFVSSHTHENVWKPKTEKQDKNALKRPGKLEAWIGSILHFLLDI